MIGVILWSDRNERKAVVWCEDQGDLAFLGCGEKSPKMRSFFEAGDVLKFDVEIDGDFRSVSNPRLVHEGNVNTADVATKLERVKRSNAVNEGKVIPFRGINLTLSDQIAPSMDFRVEAN